MLNSRGDKTSRRSPAPGPTGLTWALERSEQRHAQGGAPSQEPVGTVPRTGLLAGIPYFSTLRVSSSSFQLRPATCSRWWHELPAWGDISGETVPTMSMTSCSGRWRDGGPVVPVSSVPPSLFGGAILLCTVLPPVACSTMDSLEGCSSCSRPFRSWVRRPSTVYARVWWCCHLL